MIEIWPNYEKQCHVKVERQIANEKTYNKSRKIATTYQVGDYVDIINVDTTVGANKKLISKYNINPYVVNKVLGADRYVETDISGIQNGWKRGYAVKSIRIKISDLAKKISSKLYFLYYNVEYIINVISVNFVNFKSVRDSQCIRMNEL